VNCQDVQKFIHAYLDDEFDEREWAALSAHLELCASCRRMAQFEERFREALKAAAAPGPAAPPSLRDRVRAGLDAVDQEGGERSERGRSWLQLWMPRLVPAGAALALLVGWLATRDLRRAQPVGAGGGAASGASGVRAASGASSLSSLAEQSIEWHRLRPPMDVTASSPEAVQRYFSDKVPFAVRPPRFRAARSGAQLVGARLANLREHRAVFVTYELRGERVSVFIFDSNAVPAAGGRVMRVGQRSIRWQDVHGYNVALYTSGGTGYAVTSEMDPGRLVRLIEHSD
jgi:mycothiol system anti-sigma-R factor